MELDFAQNALPNLEIPMQGLPFVLLFTALTFLSWGAYGPLLRYGTTAMGHDGLKAFVGVGLAYFVIAVLVPFAILQKKGEKGKWTLVGTTYSIIAGSVGAIGALGIILALVFKGDPVFVMPLVFGFAPIVNTLVTAWMSGTLNKIQPVFVGGIIAAALGASGVLYFKPSSKPSPQLTKAHNEGSSSKSTTPDKHDQAKGAVNSKNLDSSKSSSPAFDESLSAKAIGLKKPNSNPPTNPPTTPSSTDSPTKVADAKPLFATQPTEGQPPVPVQPPPPVPTIVAALPENGQPPVPEKRAPIQEPAVIAARPEDGQPPQPDAAKPKATPAPAASTTPDTNSKLPPPVVNPESDEQTKPGQTKPEQAQPEQPKQEQPKQPEAKQPEPAAASGKELPPPVPNPESDLSAHSGRSLSHVRLVSTVDTTDKASDKSAAEHSSSEAKPAMAHNDSQSSGPNTGMIALSILMAALCWGSYGPMLHKGQMKMGGSRLRPFACVGIAYFIIAVAVPLVLLYTTPAISHGAWTIKGMFWSVIAGGAGAIGALGIILAFNAGGKPIYVMPLVFGFAPVINTFISLTEAGTWSKVDTMFWVSLGVVIAGAITVLTTAPKAAHGPAHGHAPVGAK